ncbi:hypothetical protein R3I94_002776 [Phoxinus phoxinus]
MGRSSLKFIGVCIEHAQLDSSPTCLITPQGFSQTDEQRSSPQRPKQRLALRVVPCGPSHGTQLYANEGGMLSLG